MTEEEKRRARYERRSSMLGDRIAAYKAKHWLSNEDLAKGLGVSRGTVGKIVSGEDVKISIMTVWQLLEVAGLTVKPREEHGNERDGA